jgi:2-polyprenyl-6-methoxyphenol hydroxylase-like FAD-dependent oxidoreductase
VVEKHASTLNFPKGRRVTTRTVEIFDSWGLETAVAADGAHGRTRDALGIDRSGPGTLGHRLSILVNANMGTRMVERQSAVY